MTDHAKRIQQEVTEIVQVLARRHGKEIRDAWTEALSMHPSGMTRRPRRNSIVNTLV
jgi:hypothetical protein